MAEDELDPPAAPDQGGAATALDRPQRQLLRVVMISLVAIVLLAILMAWLTRKQIADEIISGQLEKMGLPATYEVESIGPNAEVLRNLVIGDPANPDLTVERVKVAIVPRWGMPDVGRITLTRPRIYGSYKRGKFSFGSLDKVLFTGSKEPFRLPGLDVAIIDGRGRLASDFGPVGFKLDGAGGLRDGFAGEIAAIAPKANAAGCAAERASLYGKLAMNDEKPRFTGPVRLGGLVCAKQALRLGASAFQLDTTIDAPLTGAEGKIDLAAGMLALGGNRLGSASGQTRFTFRKGALTAHYDLAGKRLDTPEARLASLGSKGVLRAADNFARLEVEGGVVGGGLQMGGWLDGTLAVTERGSAGTLAAPLIAQMRAGLRREAPGSRIAANFILRQTGAVTSLTVPQGRVTGASGQALLALSRFQMTADGLSAARLSGNFTTGGRGLPQISGRMERGGSSGMTLRAAMAEYAAGPSRVALPELVLVQSRNGSLGFAGAARLSGPLPGGEARNLSLPIEGTYAPGRGLLAWRQCVPVSFDSLSLANLTLQRRSLTLCPPPGGAIFASDARGTRVAAGASSLDLAGRLGATPIRISGGAMGMAWPGTLAARSLDVEIGPKGDASKFRIANLAARIGGDVAGKFTGGDVRLSGVPLDVLEAKGDWRFANGKLSISGADFRLEDRWADKRFQPLVSSGADLQLANNIITAHATMREPLSQREITRADIRHDLGNGVGFADLAIDGIVFDRALQPDTITRLALGVVANAEGTVRGAGRIDWNPEVTTSTGSFTTDAFDFAAAFGPVKGLSGTVHFTDMLNLVTAPDQRLEHRLDQSRHRGQRRRGQHGIAAWKRAGGQWRALAIPRRHADPEADPDAARRRRNPALHADHRRAQRGQIRAAHGHGQHSGHRHLRRRDAAGVRRERRAARRRPAGLAPARRQCLLCRRADLQGPLGDGQFRLRCAEVARLPAHADRPQRAAGGRDRHQGVVRRNRPGRKSAAQFHHQADRQAADPVQRQPARAVLQAGRLLALALRSQRGARPARAWPDRQ